MRPPRIVGIGGAARPGSSTERVLIQALRSADELGAETRLYGGAFLAELPLFNPYAEPSPRLLALAEAVREADGVILASPGYHGSVSGLLKNALDGLEVLRDDLRPYLDGRAVGCIVTADGWQAAGATLAALRAIVHALRGWPTPLGAALRASPDLLDAEGFCREPRDAAQLETVGRQVCDFARRMQQDAKAGA